MPLVFGADEEVIWLILFMVSSKIGGILALVALWHRKKPAEAGQNGLESSCLRLPMVDEPLHFLVVDHRHGDSLDVLRGRREIESLTMKR